MLKLYAFLKKEFDYYRIIEIKPIDKAIADFTKIENYDLAFPISDSAAKLYNEIIKNNSSAYIKPTFNRYEINELDFYVFSQKDIDEIKDKLSQDGVDVQDEDIINEITFEKEKEEILKNILNDTFVNISIYEFIKFFEYFELNNKFIQNGFYITEDNKEDIFIEIIEKDDDKLLSDLERFLSIRQDVSEFRKNFELYYVLKDELEYVSYWDYDSLEEALTELKKLLQEKKLEFKSNFDPETTIDLINKIKYERIKRKVKEKQEKNPEE